MPTRLKIPSELDDRVTALAAETGEKRDQLLQRIFENALEEIEDHYRAMDVLRRIEAGEEEVSSLDAVEQRLGLAD